MNQFLSTKRGLSQNFWPLGASGQTQKISDVTTLKLRRFITIFDCCTQHILLREFSTLKLNSLSIRSGNPVILTTIDCIRVEPLTQGILF